MLEGIISLLRDVLVSSIGVAITYLYTNRKKMKMKIQCAIKYRNQEIRVSLSYLYRIKCNNKYLLVKNRKITGQYQPVGGVYKSYSTAQNCFDQLEIHQYNGFNYEDDFKNDLRVKVPSKNLSKFVDWFKSKEDRELDPIREFYEELVAPGYLSKQGFRYFDYRFIKQEQTDIKYSEYFECNELLIYNIYELMPNKEQQKDLESLMLDENDYYRWFTVDEINRLGHTLDGDYRVGEHTLLIK